ncbi:translesion DNA synthesis-associated protein ImuA [Maribrevibacterium harenarium]|uniref:Translesion DNA synthesis-associated protein ImuA n=1 Tax=Maribrevibacterium harenarium TaxID=2589817 RepID=A0A501X5H1_9GAMM|nr:translesion DNA synthesis-associated protein ImuA [Maribrevibacterium harenarium]TPE55647.1 translesion DNA synthesis-associated protein ImuA [Maribrevibacterium harenarium]
MGSLGQLSEQGLIWKGNQTRSADGLNQQIAPNRSTGFEALDRLLLCGGWPESGLVELLVPANGVGELSLLLPWLARTIQEEGRKVAFINAPLIPNIATLVAYGIAPQQVWLLRAQNQREVLWSQQQCLQEGHCCALFMWHDAKTSPATLRKLHHAAQRGRCLGISIRPTSVQQSATPAPYRLQLESVAGQAQVTALKRRGGWGGESVRLDLTAKPKLPPLPGNNVELRSLN